MYLATGVEATLWTALLQDFSPKLWRIQPGHCFFGIMKYFLVLWNIVCIWDFRVPGQLSPPCPTWDTCRYESFVFFQIVSLTGVLRSIRWNFDRGSDVIIFRWCDNVIPTVNTGRAPLWAPHAPIMAFIYYTNHSLGAIFQSKHKYRNTNTNTDSIHDTMFTWAGGQHFNQNKMVGNTQTARAFLDSGWRVLKRAGSESAEQKSGRDRTKRFIVPFRTI